MPELPFQPTVQNRMLEIETLVIGEAISRRSFFASAQSRLTKASFTEQMNKDFWSLLETLYSAGRDWTFEIVMNEIKATNRYRDLDVDATGRKYRAGFEEGNSDHVKWLADATMLRELAANTSQVFADFVPGRDPAEYIAATRANLDKMASDLKSTDGVSATVVAQSILASLAAGNKRPVVKTGLAPFDDLTDGLMPSFFYILAARPSQGKTAVALSMAINVAKAGTPVLFFSTETTKEILTTRVLSSVGRDISSFDILRGTASVERVAAAVPCIPQRLTVFEASRNVWGVTDTIAQWRQNNKGPCVVFIDYLEEIKGPKGIPERESLSYIVSELHGASKAYDIAMILCSQINRAGASDAKAPGRDKKKAYRPTMEHLKGTGKLEQAADMVVMLWNDDDDLDPAAEYLDVDAHVLKNKISGRNGSFRIRIDKAHSKATDKQMAPAVY